MINTNQLIEHIKKLEKFICDIAEDITPLTIMFNELPALMFEDNNKLNIKVFGDRIPKKIDPNHIWTSIEDPLVRKTLKNGGKI